MCPEPHFVYFEDDELSRTVMESVLLRKLGYSQLTMFENSENILAKVGDLPAKPSVFFVDIHLTPHNGFEIMSVLRNHDAYRNAMIVAVTASVMNEEVDQLQAAGFNGVLAKPLNLETFPGKLERILAGDEIWDIV